MTGVGQKGRGGRFLFKPNKSDNKSVSKRNVFNLCSAAVWPAAAAKCETEENGCGALSPAEASCQRPSSSIR